MKTMTIVVLTFSMLIASVALFASAATDQAAENRSSAIVQGNSQECPRYPIAPGVWYPGDGPLPKHPVRYYRARCFPGCHSGSQYGMYPQKRLDYHPIYPTSTIHHFERTND